MRNFIKLIFSVTVFLLAGLPPLASQDTSTKYLRQLKREAKDQIKDLERQGYDIIIPIEETVPEQLLPFYVQNIENWGEKILLPAELRRRVAAECTGRVHVKVYDTGDALDHPDLATGQETGRNYSNGQDLIDLHGHSTHVAGIIAAKGFGLAWELVEKGLVTWTPVKFLNDGGGASYTTIASGIENEKKYDDEYLNKGIPVVINCSFGGGTTAYEPLERALKASIETGVTYLFAAGNTGKDVNYPGRSPNVAAISSLDEPLTISSFSSRGPEVFLGAPGRGILSTYKNKAYATMSGTSMAAPFATALVTIAHSRWPGKLANKWQVENYFQHIATDLTPEGRDDLTGWGIAYVRAILDTDPATIGDQPDPDPDPKPDPDPEPEPDPDPVVKPKRTFTYELPMYEMKWRIQKEDAVHRVGVVMRVEISDTQLAEKTYDQVRAAADQFFNYSALYLSKDSDYDDAAFWTAYFFRLLLRDKLDILPVHVVGYDEDLRSTVLEGQRLNRIKGIKSLFLKKKPVKDLNAAYDPKVYWAFNDIP